MKITVLIPVLNEVSTIKSILEKIKENKNLELEIERALRILQSTLLFSMT